MLSALMEVICAKNNSALWELVRGKANSSYFKRTARRASETWGGSGMVEDVDVMEVFNRVTDQILLVSRRLSELEIACGIKQEVPTAVRDNNKGYVCITLPPGCRDCEGVCCFLL